MKSVLTKTIPLIAVLAVIIIFAITCTAIKGRTKVVPVPDGYETDNYLEIKEGNYTYSIDKKTMYDELKKGFGLSTIITTFDRYILKNEKTGDKTYYDTVTDAEIDEAIEEATFPDGRDGLTSEEIDEAIEKYTYSMFTQYGYKSDEEIRDHYHLVLAKKVYAKTKLAEEIKEQDDKAEKEANDSTIADADKAKPYFDADKVKEYYTANYVQGYWAIILPFSSQTTMNNALAQLSLKLHSRDSSITDDYNHWVKTTDEGEVALTVEEIITAYIELYNMMYAYKTDEYPTTREILVEGKQYTIDPETKKYSFNTAYDEENEENNTLYWSHTDLSAFQSSVQTHIKNSMYSYDPATSTTDKTATWYTATSRTYSSVYYLILKIGEKEAPKQEDVKAEIIEKLTEEALTDEYINTKMAELRAEKNILIYDEKLEENYISSMESFKVEYTKSKEENAKVVAKIDGYEITANDLYKKINTSYGPAMVLSEITYQRFLVNNDLNKYYDKANDEWKDKEKYKEILESISNLKLSFSSGQYSYYGYDPATMSWESFLQDINGAKDENELKFNYLYGSVLEDQIAKYNNIVEKEEDDDSKYVLTEDSDLWKLYVEHMQKIVDQYFSVEGVHTLISVYENALDAINLQNPIDPEEWTDYQVTLAKELHDAILVYIEEQPGSVQDKMKAIAEAFKNAPRYVASIEPSVDQQPVVADMEYTFENILVSKYKSAGLMVQYQDLGAFTNGKMVEAFNDAVKSIWDANPDSSELVMYENYLPTEFGYHVYANLKTVPIAEWTDVAIFQVHTNTEAEEEANLAPYIEWKYVGESDWKKLVDFADADITLEKNKTLSFQIKDEQVQYKYVDTKDANYSDDWKNLITLEAAGIDTEKKQVLPSLGLVRTYLANSADTNLTEAMKTAYTTYFSKLYEEVNGSANFQIKEYEMYKGFELTLNVDNAYDKAVLYDTIDKSIRNNTESFSILYQDKPKIETESE